MLGFIFTRHIYLYHASFITLCEMGRLQNWKLLTVSNFCSGMSNVTLWFEYRLLSGFLWNNRISLCICSLNGETGSCFSLNEFVFWLNCFIFWLWIKSICNCWSNYIYEINGYLSCNHSCFFLKRLKRICRDNPILIRYIPNCTYELYFFWWHYN